MSLVSIEQDPISARRLSSGPSNHFFGYYGINPWSSDGQHHLALETDFHDRRPEPGDIAQVGLVDKTTGLFTRLGQTHSFNLQQGSMMHWVHAGHSEEFTYNDAENGRLISQVVDPRTGTKRKLEGAVAAVSPSAPKALGLNFHRMAQCRPVVGYSSNDTPELVDVPDDDGISQIDLISGASRLLLSHREVLRQRISPTPPQGITWFNHLLYNPSGTRFMFFCRVKQPEEWKTSLWTANADGSELECQIPWGPFISHYHWRDDERLLITSDILGDFCFVEFTDRKKDFKPFAPGSLPPDGHPCFSPDGKWLLTDVSPRSAPDWGMALLLLEVESRKRYSLGNYRCDPIYTGDIRCDLHPRWSMDGNFVTFDSVHEGDRQIYEIDVRPIVHA